LKWIDAQRRDEMSTQKSTRQKAATVEDNALRLDTEKAEQIIEALNADLADAYVLYHQLHKHHWNVEGAEFLEIHVFLQEVYEDVEDAADEVAERLQALGGVPHASMTTLAENATVEAEDEDVYDIRTSLENDLEMMGDIIESYREHIALAEGLGDYATEEMLREQLETIEEHAHHIEHYLEDDSLVLESATK
jgi:DNA-binding ferritin-like protein